MTKDQIISRLCSLMSNVANHFQDDLLESDCICGENEFIGDKPQVNNKIIEFIELSVKNNLKRQTILRDLVRLKKAEAVAEQCLEKLLCGKTK